MHQVRHSRAGNVKSILFHLRFSFSLLRWNIRRGEEKTLMTGEKKNENWPTDVQTTDIYLLNL